MLLLSGRKILGLSAPGAGRSVPGPAGLRSFLMENIAFGQRLNSLTATDGAVSILSVCTPQTDGRHNPSSYLSKLCPFLCPWGSGMRVVSSQT